MYLYWLGINTIMLIVALNNWSWKKFKTWHLKYCIYFVYTLRYRYTREASIRHGAMAPWRHLGILTSSWVMQYSQWFNWIGWPQKYWCSLWNSVSILPTTIYMCVFKLKLFHVGCRMFGLYILFTVYAKNRVDGNYTPWSSNVVRVQDLFQLRFELDSKWFGHSMSNEHFHSLFSFSITVLQPTDTK